MVLFILTIVIVTLYKMHNTESIMMKKTIQRFLNILYNTYHIRATLVKFIKIKITSTIKMDRLWCYVRTRLHDQCCGGGWRRI